MASDDRSDGIDSAELRGMATILAEVVRYGHPDLARAIAAAHELTVGDLIDVAAEGDLDELRRVLKN